MAYALRAGLELDQTSTVTYTVFGVYINARAVSRNAFQCDPVGDGFGAEVDDLGAVGCRLTRQPQLGH